MLLVEFSSSFILVTFLCTFHRKNCKMRQIIRSVAFHFSFLIEEVRKCMKEKSSVILKAERGTKQAEKIWSIYNLKKGIGNLISDFRTSFQLSITSSSSSLRDKISQKGLKNKCSEGEKSIAKIQRNNPFLLQDHWAFTFTFASHSLEKINQLTSFWKPSLYWDFLAKVKMGNRWK